MRNEKKLLPSIPPPYKRMPEELTDYKFFYFFKFLRSHYSMEACVRFFQTLCEMFHCDKPIIMNLIVDIQMYPVKYKHDIRHVAFLMYAMDMPVPKAAWILRTSASQVRSWTKQQLMDCPEIKRLFTDEQTSEIMKLLSTWKVLKGLPI